MVILHISKKLSNHLYISIKYIHFLSRVKQLIDDVVYKLNSSENFFPI